MRILIPFKIEPSVEKNPFIDVLSEGLSNFGHKITCSKDEFWENPEQYDLIFFQWPDWILPKGHLISKDIFPLREHLEKLKKMKIPLVITVHNLHPHNNDPFTKSVYDTIYEYVDAFHHMGKYSHDYLKAIYPNKFHFVVPHPVFYDLDDLLSSRKDYRKKFNLPQKPTILAFGVFRTKSERKMFIKLSHHFFLRGCCWAPKFNRFYEKDRSLWSKAFTRFKYRLNGIKMFKGPIDDKLVMEMAVASDILLIQRIDILNSGNLPLGFAGGNIVIGPDVGNVGEILRETGNLVFDPADIQSLYAAVTEAIELIKQGNNLGKANLEYAKQFWNKARVAFMLNDNITELKMNFL